ncbi:MAG: basic amino acid ABC transporter substrate-binding protein [Oscillospiraceae bacterium]|nr:basic amino acid ABC transporter substrate-binding protein [Oscillospiraceae bacterium]
MKRVFAVILTLAMLSMLLVACANGFQGSQSEQVVSEPEPVESELIMATNAEFPPFEFINDAGDFDGFDVKLAEAIAKEIGMKLTIDNMNFDSIITAVTTERADAGIAAMSITEERLEEVNFTDPYFETTLVVIVPQDSSITSPSDLNDKNIAVQEGTTSDLFVTENEDLKEPQRFKKAPDTVVELKTGRVDAIVIDRGVADQFIGDNPDLKILDEDLGKEEYGMAVNKGNTELLTKINGAIKKLKESGEYQEIFDTFFAS